MLHVYRWMLYGFHLVHSIVHWHCTANGSGTGWGKEKRVGGGVCVWGGGGGVAPGSVYFVNFVM